MKKVERVLSNMIVKKQSPSVQYLHFDQNGLIYKFQEGFADIKSQKRINDLTTYNLFSVTKTFTALAVLRLAEQGKINIEDPVHHFLPDFPYPKAITIWHLLAHTSGIPNPIPLSWIHLVEDHPSFDRDLFFKVLFKKNPKVKSKPNEKFSYSNLGYEVLGQLIEAVSGVPYIKYIRDHILRKLSLAPHELGFRIEKPANHAKGYQKQFSLLNWILGFFIDKSKFMASTEEQWKPFRNYYVNGAPYGGLIGTPSALMHYAQELLKPDCSLISNEFRNMLFTENLTDNNKASGMCLSWFTGQVNNYRYFHHAGGGGGYYCEVRIYPEPGLGSVVVFNRTGVRDERVLDTLDKYFL